MHSNNLLWLIISVLIVAACSTSQPEVEIELTIETRVPLTSASISETKLEPTVSAVAETNTPVVVPTSTSTPVVVPTSTFTPTVAPTSTSTPTVAPTSTLVNYSTFINRDNGLIFVLPQTWERKVESGGLQIFWSDADLTVLNVEYSHQDLDSFVENWFINKPLFVETKRTEQNNMQIVTGSLGKAYRQFVFIGNAANDVSVFTFSANPDYLENYLHVFNGIQDSIEIDASLIPHTHTPTPIPTMTPIPVYTHVNGKQIPTKTVAGTDSCDQRFSETAFCIELLVYEGVTDAHVQKAINGLSAIVGRYPVSESELTVTWPDFGPIGGIQSYLGYVIWDPETSSKDEILDDLCMFRSVSDGLHIKVEKELCLARVLGTGSLDGTTNGGANQSGAELRHNGYVIHSGTALYNTDLRHPTSPAKSLFADPRKVTAHEYFHSYQSSHGVRILGAPLPPNLVPKTGPIWLIEGSAEYAAVRVSSLEGWMNWETQLKERMNVAKDALAAYPNKSIDDHTTPEQRQNNDQESANMGHALSYELAIWAVAYAISVSSHDAIMVNYWDDLEGYGHEESFRRNVGMSLQEFYISFDEFRKKTLDEQYGIIATQISQ